MKMSLFGLCPMFAAISSVFMAFSCSKKMERAPESWGGETKQHEANVNKDRVNDRPKTESQMAMDKLAVGALAPSFHVVAHDGVELDSAKLRGQSIVLYFYPKDETPGCTKEACSFRDAWTELAKSHVTLIGVSADDDASHKRFAEKYKLPFHLVSDPKGELCRTYGVSFALGFSARNTVVIGPDGTIKKVYRSVDVTKHADEIRGDLATL